MNAGQAAAHGALVVPETTSGQPPTALPGRPSNMTSTIPRTGAAMSYAMHYEECAAEAEPTAWAELRRAVLLTVVILGVTWAILAMLIAITDPGAV